DAAKLSHDEVTLRVAVQQCDLPAASRSWQVLARCCGGHVQPLTIEAARVRCGGRSSDRFQIDGRCVSIKAYRAKMDRGTWLRVDPPDLAARKVAHRLRREATSDDHGSWVWVKRAIRAVYDPCRDRR